MELAGFLGIIAAILAISAAVFGQNWIREQLGMNVNTNKTILLKPGILEGLQQLRTSSSTDLSLCAYGEWKTPSIIVIDDVGECTGTPEMIVKVRTSKYACEPLIDEISLLDSKTLLGIVCYKQGLFVYDLDNLKMTYEVKTGDVI